MHEQSKSARGPEKTRWAIGALTLWPPVYMLLFFAFIGTMAVAGPGLMNEGAFRSLFVVHFLTILVIFVLIAIYAVDVFRNPAVPEDRRVMWLVLVLLVGIFAMPVYWWLFMRRSPS